MKKKKKKRAGQSDDEVRGRGAEGMDSDGVSERGGAVHRAPLGRPSVAARSSSVCLAVGSAPSLDTRREHRPLARPGARSEPQH